MGYINAKEWAIGYISKEEAGKRSEPDMARGRKWEEHDRGAQALLTAFNELQKAISYLAQDLQGIDTKVSNLKKPT